MTMHNPPHPGGIVRRQCLEPLGVPFLDPFVELPPGRPIPR